MLYNTITELGWDSQFFGYSVAAIRLQKADLKLLDDLINNLKKKNIRLTYIYVSPGDDILNKNILKKGGILVDQKTVFTKSSKPHTGYDIEIMEYTDSEPNQKIIKLGLQAGIFSRFNLDKGFRNHEFERLYTQWVINSVNRSIALKFIVALQKNEIIGITTIGKKNNYADLGLVAVDNNYRGIGVGSELIKYSENIAFNLSLDTIKVVTQLKNKAACRLYEKCNFSIESITNIYHLWR